MGKVIANMSMSLDGFIAGPNDEVDQVFKWYSSGDTEYTMPGGTTTVQISSKSAELLQDAHGTTKALVTGRRTFDLANAWDGKHPLDVPVFIVTHSSPEESDTDESPFTFVTTGIENAVEIARNAAGGGNVAVSGASITQQCIEAGLLDEIHIDLVPVLIGDGIRMFEHLETELIELESTRVVETPGVTHLGYRIVNEEEN